MLTFPAGEDLAVISWCVFIRIGVFDLDNHAHALSTFSYFIIISKKLDDMGEFLLTHDFITLNARDPGALVGGCEVKVQDETLSLSIRLSNQFSQNRIYIVFADGVSSHQGRRN